MGNVLYYEIEATTPGMVPLKDPLPDGVPTPTCVVIEVATLAYEPAACAATAMLDDRDMAFVGIDSFHERLEDLIALIESDAKYKFNADPEILVLREFIKIYDLLNAKGWILDPRLRYTY